MKLTTGSAAANQDVRPSVNRPGGSREIMRAIATPGGAGVSATASAMGHGSSRDLA